MPRTLAVTLLALALGGSVIRAEEPKVAPQDVTKWEVGMLLTFPKQSNDRFFIVGKIVDKGTVAVYGLEESVVVRNKRPVNTQTTWYRPFAVKMDSKGLIERKRVKLEGVYKVVDTVQAKVREGDDETIYVLEKQP